MTNTPASKEKVSTLAPPLTSIHEHDTLETVTSQVKHEAHEPVISGGEPGGQPRTNCNRSLILDPDVLPESRDPDL